MSPAHTITSSLHQADDVTATLAACWDAFEYIANTAAAYAEPGSPLFYAFLSAVCSACEGRDLVGYAPSMPSLPGNAPPPLDPATTTAEAAADALAALATLIVRKLTEAAALHCTAAGDEQALADASMAATEIAGLLKPQP